MREKILILAKTIPSPSAKYIETSCVAGVNEAGVLRRLFPVPFRLLGEDEQFKKWQWVELTLDKSRDDHRPESHKIDGATMILKEMLSTRNAWHDRLLFLPKEQFFQNIDVMDERQKESLNSLGFIRPSEIISFDIVKGVAEWSDDEKAKLAVMQNQPSLFEELTPRTALNPLKKVPYDFYYQYRCAGDERVYKHKIVDWELGALYWNVCRSPDWQDKIRLKYETEFKQKDLLFMMGNQNRFRDQWLIISVIYPPKQMITDLF